MVRIHFFPAISIHALLAESDDRRRSSAAAFSDFYPRSPCGERPDAHPTLTGKDAKFLSTLSLRRATAPAKAATNDGGDFYPRSPCGERPILGNPCAGCPAISIHALLAESDRPGRRSAHRHLPISIHALLAESDGATLSRTLLTALFLSTLSLRRATALGIHSPSTVIFLSTLSLRRATCGMLLRCPLKRISIHALLAESDRRQPGDTLHTPISIHALLAESDMRPKNRKKRHNNFYPRSPCGERRQQRTATLPRVRYFYPRSPCGERHLVLSLRTDGKKHFYPRSPCGERLIDAIDVSKHQGISIHALLAESDTARSKA